jgi:hypothetical protein
MLIEGQLIKVKVIGVTLNHYRNLGYDVGCFDTIVVPPEHLTDGSKYRVKLNCDICGKELIRPYKQYLKYHTNGCDLCNQCKDKKAKQTCIDKYGVPTHMLVPEIQQKQQHTIQNKYGVDNISQSEEVKQKKKQTCMDNYGVENPMFSNTIREKLEKTNIEKYGCKSPMQNNNVRKRAELTNIERYGVKNPMQNIQIKTKSLLTLYKHHNTPTSSQQLKLYEIIKTKYKDAEINYPFGICSLDIFICINNIKIDVEYDGWYFHQDQQKDIKRDKFLQSQGLKTLRIRSSHLLPTEQELFDAIDYLVDTEHKFKEIILSDWKEEVDICQEQLQVVM